VVKRQKNRRYRHVTDTWKEQYKLGRSGLIQQQQRIQVTHKEL